MTPANLINALPDGALIIGPDGNVLAANEAAKEALGLDLKGLPVKSVLRHAAFHSGVAEVRETGSPVHIDLDMQSRPPRQFNAHIAPVDDVGTVLVVLRDLTREQRIERMRSDFVANASHEMRTPLAAIIGTIETLQGPAKNDAKAREKFFDTMLTQARRMKRLIDDLLTLSRIELNEHLRPNAKVDLVDVARQAKSNLVSLIAETNVEVNLTGTKSTIVAGDADELLQVTQNLLENAIKYGAAGGKVDVTCIAEAGFGSLAVKDYGRGIAENHIPRLTERFYRVSTQESRARGGTGLGLAIVKHIISRHRGKLDIASKLGEGSTFRISIPLYSRTT
ncbi:ATP-binding protein [Aestuariivirga litoralis]|uniref:ATP-binding protein n=1 Tax=Aestuariivirga litoralis TaxID=2650924 RepID=UPI0018C47175|nr:ATP-binding protein [Aestuariivirga litoralis]MBG1233747.1 PAS domain-containing protein [Aestuariivirga litoralis]